MKIKLLIGTLLFVVVVAMAAIMLACSASESNQTPVAPSTPAPAVAPTAAPAPTATLAPGASTPAPIVPTPTKIASTSTAVPVVTGKPVYGGTLRHALAVSASSMDPPFGVGGSIEIVRFLIYNQIVALGTNMDIVPDLAQSWDISPDGKTLTFHLRKGVKFQDGTDFNAQAVKWNLDRCLDPAVVCGSASKINVIDNITVQDDSTVVLHMKQPWRPILAALAAVAGYVVSPTAVQKYNSYSDRQGEFGRKPVGTGAFKFVEWTPGSRIIVQKNENYWDKSKPYLDSVVLQDIVEASSRLAMIRTGESDIIESPSADALLQVRNNANVKVDEYASGRNYQVLFNVTKPPFDNKALRQAISYGLDRQAIIDINFGGRGKVAYSIVGVGWAYDPTIKTYEYNLQKAKEKLAEAGYPSGLSFPYLCKSDAGSIQLCEMFQAQFKKLGLNATIEPIPSADFSPRRRDGKFNICDSYRTPLGDPHVLINELYQKGGPGNYMGYSNPDVDKLMDQAGGVFDTAKAAALYSQIQKLINEDAPSVYYMFSTEFVMLNKKVQNFMRTPDLDLKFRDLWLEK